MVYALTVYGFSGASSSTAVLAQNEKLIQAAFEALAELGPVPVIIGGDLNLDPEESEVIRAALCSGSYFDALRWSAHQQGLEPADTCITSNNRLDFFLLSREACSAFSCGDLLEHVQFPTHKPVFADFHFGNFRQACLIRHVPAEIPNRKDLADSLILRPLSAEESEHRVSSIQVAQWKAACDSGDTQQLLQIWCTRAETFLLLEAGVPNDMWHRFRGRGRPKQPKLGYVCKPKRSNDSLSGAQFSEAKQLSDLLGKLREVLRQLQTQSSNLQMGPLSVSILRTWSNAQNLYCKLGFGKVPDSPSWENVPVLIDKIELCRKSLVRDSWVGLLLGKKKCAMIGIRVAGKCSNGLKMSLFLRFLF